jgi:hypothetical protein
MTSSKAPNETAPAAGETRPTIETIDQAAAEIKRLYDELDKAAVDLTPGYLRQRLDGEEGVTWDMFPRVGFLRRPTPYLDPILRRDGAIVLGGGYDMWFNLRREYDLSKNTMLVPGDNDTFTKADAVTVRRAGGGYDPGDAYIVVGDRVLKADHGHRGPVPSTGSDGKLEWSASRDWVTDAFRDMEAVDADLIEVVERLRAYEPAVEQPAA